MIDSCGRDLQDEAGKGLRKGAAGDRPTSALALSLCRWHSSRLLCLFPTRRPCPSDVRFRVCTPFLLCPMALSCPCRAELLSLSVSLLPYERLAGKDHTSFISLPRVPGTAP